MARSVMVVEPSETTVSCKLERAVGIAEEHGEERISVDGGLEGSRAARGCGRVVDDIEREHEIELSIPVHVGGTQQGNAAAGHLVAHARGTDAGTGTA